MGCGCSSLQPKDNRSSVGNETVPKSSSVSIIHNPFGSTKKIDPTKNSLPRIEEKIYNENTTSINDNNLIKNEKPVSLPLPPPASSQILPTVSNPLVPLSSSMITNNNKDPLDILKETVEGFKPEYKLGNLIGKGSFGHVYTSSHRKTGNNNFAIKIMDRNRIKSSSIYREWMVLEHIGTEAHRGIVNYFATYKTKRDVSFVFELMSGGELFDRLVSFGVDNENIVREAFRPVIEGLIYLHSRGIVHRDIKPENLLLKMHPPNSNAIPILKISDFGLSQLINPNERLLKICGTAPYSAPEMFQPDKPGYDLKFDCFSMGVVLYVALVGYHPFDPNGTSAVVDIKARARNVIYDFSGTEWANISDVGKDLIRRLIIKDPDNRLESKMILQHPWFRQDFIIPPTVMTNVNGYTSTVPSPTGPILQTKGTDGAMETVLPSDTEVTETHTATETTMVPSVMEIGHAVAAHSYVGKAGGGSIFRSTNRLAKSLTHVDGVSLCEEITMDIDNGNHIPPLSTYDLREDKPQGPTVRSGTPSLPPPIDTTLPKNISQVTMSDVSYPYPSPFTSPISSVSSPSGSSTTDRSFTASTFESINGNTQGGSTDNRMFTTDYTTKVPTLPNDSHSLRNQTKSLSPRHSSFGHYIDSSELAPLNLSNNGSVQIIGSQSYPPVPEQQHHHHHHHSHRHHHYSRIHHRLTYVTRIHPYCGLCSSGNPLHTHACLSRYPTYSGPSDGRSSVASLPATSPTNLAHDLSIPNNLLLNTTTTTVIISPRPTNIPTMDIAEPTYQGGIHTAIPSSNMNSSTTDMLSPTNLSFTIRI